jgi:hypothetical protein
MKSILSLLFLLACTNYFSQKLVLSRLLPCNIFGEVIFKERIASQRFSNDTLYLEINLSANCAAQFKSTLQSNNDSIFIELKNISETHDACDCCYTMLFTIAEVQNPSYTLFINDKQFKFSKSRYIHFPPLYIPENLVKNESDASGNKIGYWLVKPANGKFYFSYYGDGTYPENKPQWTKCFSKTNELENVSVLLDNGFTHHFEKNQYERIIEQITAEEQTSK